jgi:hypothetical protein
MFIIIMIIIIMLIIIMCLIITPVRGNRIRILNDQFTLSPVYSIVAEIVVVGDGVDAGEADVGQWRPQQGFLKQEKCHGIALLQALSLC